MIAKESSSNTPKFIEQHGKNVWELEALRPQVLQKILTEAIESVLDIDAFNREVEAESADAAYIAAARQSIIKTIGNIE